MAHDVFISYSSKNKTTADAICHVLEEHEIKCWIAPRDIVGGEKYGNVIESAIKSCKVFVIIFSEESRISPWVESELNLAFTDRRTIVPFKIDSSVLEGEMRLILNNKHWIEAYPNPELKFKDLIEAVSRSIGKLTLNEAEKHNMEVQKQLQDEREQLEIEKERLRKEQLQNDKAQKDIEEKTNFTNKSEINTKETITNSQGKKTNFPFIIIMSVIFIGIILIFILMNGDNKSNIGVDSVDYIDTTMIDTVAAVDTTEIINKDNSVKVVDNNLENTQKRNKTGTFTDSRDGHVYKWVKIGDQIWMAENLQATTYNDGEKISIVKDFEKWKTLKTGACCFYENDESNIKKYGYLYNWYAVDSKKLSPIGWHVASDIEWTELENFLIENGYGNNKYGDIRKSLASKTGCEKVSDKRAIGYKRETNNSSGFSALPGGARYADDDGYFGNYGFLGKMYHGIWWTSTQIDANVAWIRDLNYYSNEPLKGRNTKYAGHSVRCIKD